MCYTVSMASRAGQETTRGQLHWRAFTTRHWLVGIGMLVYGGSWLIPHSLDQSAGRIRIPLVVADAGRQTSPVAALSRSRAQEASAAQTVEGSATVSFEEATDGRVDMLLTIGRCAPDSGCLHDVADRVISARRDAAMSALTARRGALTTAAASANARLEQARAAAGAAADTPVTEFAAAAVNRGERRLAADWQTNFDELRAYDWVHSERMAIETLTAESAALADETTALATLIGTPQFERTSVARPRGLVATAVALAGLLLAIVALAFGRRLHPERRWGLRSGVPALVARAVLLALGVVAVLGARYAWSARQTPARMDRLRTALVEVDANTALREIGGVRSAVRNGRGLVDFPATRLLTLLPAGGDYRDRISSYLRVLDGNLAAGEGLSVALTTLDSDTAMSFGDQVRTLRDSLQEAEQSLSSVTSPTPLLSDGLARFAEGKGVDDLRASAHEAGVLLGAVTHAIDSGDRYLLLVGSSSEPRNASGGYFMIGSFTMDDQGPRLEHLRGIGAELTDTRVPFVDASTVSIGDRDLPTTWGAFGPGADWTSLALSPRFDATSPVASSMWKSVTGEDVAGVVYVDPITLRQLLRVTGPVQADGTELNVENSVGWIDDLQYRAEGGAAPDPEQRQQVLRDLVKGLLEKVRQSRSSSSIARVLQPAIRGRHVMFWSADAEVQTAVAGSDITGAIKSSSLVANAALMSGKYGPYMHVSLEGSTACADDGKVHVSVSVTTTFDPDIPLHDYLAGSAWFPKDPETTGVLVTMGVPASAEVDLADQPQLAIYGPDGPIQQLATWAKVSRGETVVTTFGFTMAGGSELSIEASGTGYPRLWTFDADTWDAFEGRHVVTLDAC